MYKNILKRNIPIELMLEFTPNRLSKLNIKTKNSSKLRNRLKFLM